MGTEVRTRSAAPTGGEVMTHAVEVHCLCGIPRAASANAAPGHVELNAVLVHIDVGTVDGVLADAAVEEAATVITLELVVVQVGTAGQPASDCDNVAAGIEWLRKVIQHHIRRTHRSLGEQLPLAHWSESRHFDLLAAGELGSRRREKVKS